MIHEPMHTCQFGGTARCIACYTETNAKKEYQKSLEHEPMHSCGEVTDEPCDACINEEEEREEQPSSEQKKNILKRLKKIEEEEKEIAYEIDKTKIRLCELERNLMDITKEKSEIIIKLL